GTDENTGPSPSEKKLKALTRNVTETCDDFRRPPSPRPADGTGHAFHTGVETIRQGQIDRTREFSGRYTEPRASVVLPGCARPPRGGPGFFFFYDGNTVL